MKKIVEKIIVICIITCILTIQTIHGCRAEGENIGITVRTSMAFPFRYEEEAKQIYKILQYGDKVAYSLTREFRNSNNYSQLEPYTNKIGRAHV